MKYILLISIFIASYQITFGQASTSEKSPISADTSKIFEIVEAQPEFPGGPNAMMAFISSNVMYPEIALENGIEGTVVVQFVIEKDGSITDIKVVRDPGGGLGREAERVIKEMPKWSPGRQKGEPVRVKMSAPIRFRLKRDIPMKVLEDNSIYLKADQNATYSGGEDAMKSYITSQLVIPSIVKKKQIEGTALIYAIVEKDGTLSNIAIQESLCPECDEEAIRIISGMPAWTPAVLKNEIVRSVVLIPVYMKKQ